MCGISVILALEEPRRVSEGNGTSANARAKLAREMEESLQKIAHRGPDSQGLWISQDSRVGKQ